MTKTDFDLENAEDKNVEIPQNSAELLANAVKYGVSLDALEEIGREEVIKEQNIIENKQNTPFWYGLDIKLGELVAPLMDDSERPMVLVSDDKVVYANRAMLQVLDVKNSKFLLNEPFLSFVEKDDWNLLTSNIGEMLTSFKKLRIRLKSAIGKTEGVEFQAIYLPDSTHFSFILVGSHLSKANKPFFNNLYDDQTGLPNFFLFEDRVQMAVNNENYKDSRLPKSLIALMVIDVENAETFKKLHLEEFMLKKLSNILVLNLKKNVTVARGLKYPFWIMMPDVANGYDLEMEVKKVQSLLNEGISDNFTTHELLYNVGVSVFPNPARSAKKLVEQAIAALKIAQEKQGSVVEMFKK